MSGRPVILIGLSGAGKSTVARETAALLDTGWCDLDSRIEAAAGMPITAIFQQEGEAAFRAREQAAMQDALAEGGQVIAAGAGWAVQPGSLEDVAGRALVIHLVIEPSEAARRLAGAADRPLLQGEDGEDLVARLEAQWEARRARYRLADLEVPAHQEPALVAVGVATLARQFGGWA